MIALHKQYQRGDASLVLRFFFILAHQFWKFLQHITPAIIYQLSSFRKVRGNLVSKIILQERSQQSYSCFLHVCCVRQKRIFNDYSHAVCVASQAAQTLFVIYIRDSIALRFEPFKRMYENGSKIALNSTCSKGFK